ncbi:MAG: ferritin-like domain-containing protein [Actinomycetota bacterium]
MTIVDVPVAEPSTSGAAADRPWSARFAAVAGQHRDVAVDVSEIEASRLLAECGPSLATFQLGETGTGEHLFAAARIAGVDDDYLAALRAFVVEEQEHARMLGLLLDAIAQPRRRSHWSDRIFVVLRRFRSLRTEVLTLLVAELVAVRYYSALAAGTRVAALSELCGRIHADELRHLDFHADTLPEHLRRFGPVAGVIVRLAWNALVVVASVLVAADHGRALASVGCTRRRFVADLWSLRRDLDRRLFGPPPS